MAHTVPTRRPEANGCRAWGGCTPGDRCPEHHGSQPERIGRLAVDVLAALNGGRPRLYLIRGGKR